jgi:Cu+-exporting ATPase
MATKTFAVEGMTCGNCQAKVEKALAGLDGVSGYKVDHAADSAEVEYDQTILTAADIAAAITASGFPAKG